MKHVTLILQSLTEKTISLPLVGLIVLLLSACSSQVPLQISVAPEDAPDVAAVRLSPEAYQARQVRWGGVILNTENLDTTSRVTVIALPLSKKGRPQGSDDSPGRFIAVVDEFLEPLLYSRDRHITFTGSILGVETHKVGDFPYQYPVIRADFHHLWPKIIPQREPDYPYLWPYYPWYHPLHHPHYPYPLVPHYR